MIWIYSLVSVAIISLISLIGVFALALKEEKIKKISLFLVSFAVGGLFGDALIHLLPESFEKLGLNLGTSLLVIFGILLFFVLEKFLRWQHCHEIDCQEHVRSFAAMSLIGDAIHNLIDGMLVAASFMVSLPVGLATTLAVIFHEIPQELGNFGILIHSGLTAKKALLFNFLTALTAILGAVITLAVGSRLEGFSLILLPITAGGFLYLAGSDLLPQLHQESKPSTSLWQMLLMLLGVGIMASLTIFS
ncbi:MAG: ZIP family metal transporter [bacterium]|nr:ZIP family metal transporter [bacterium]